tara:strand:+ start:1319 stop:1588 length:270 start_codon:yes stop_codon:yes gene_type:complete
MRSIVKNWIWVWLALAIGWVSGYLVAQSTVESWYVPPPPPELIDANIRLYEHCKPELYRVIRCPDRSDFCMCRKAPPELIEELTNLQEK